MSAPQARRSPGVSVPGSSNAMVTSTTTSVPRSPDSREDVALAALSRADADVFMAGYSSGYACGVDTGYARGRADERADVAAIQRVMHQAARMPVRTPAALTADPEAMRADLLDRDRIRGEAFRHGLRAGRAAGGAA